MLRVNLLADDDFRCDVLEVIRGQLKNISGEVIKELLETNEFLNKQILEKLDHYNFAADFERWIKYTKKWEDSSLYQTLSKLVDQKVKDCFLAYQNTFDSVLVNARQILAKSEKTMVTLQEDRIRQIVAEELKRRLS